MSGAAAGSRPVRTLPVALVGAGPGDAELITCKGKRLIGQADIIVYDRLANPELLGLARPEARLISVGKKGFAEHIGQCEINAILIGEAKEHPEARIVRLKGGDPFLFGRGGEEAAALADAGIPFEVVPGVTAGIAAPAYAGIPVTHRGFASSVAFVTGHEASGKESGSIDWRHLALGCDTLCFYMGVKNLPVICDRLSEAGRPSDTPVALVRLGCLPQQETLVSTLGHVADDAAACGFAAPAIVVVGDVVRLRNDLSWFENRPLSGRTVVVTRAKAQAPDLVGRLLDLGARVLEVPAIRIEPLPVTTEMEACLAELPSFGWTVFTSVNGVELFFEALRRTGGDARRLGGCSVAAIGLATARACEAHGISPDLVPGRYVAESMARDMIAAGAAGSRILIPRALQARSTLPDLLERAGCRVELLHLYRTCTERPSEGLAQAVGLMERGEVDGVAFTSTSTAKGFRELLDREVGRARAQRLLESANLFSIGPVTSDSLREMGLEPAAEAGIYTIDGLIEAMCDTLRR